MVNDGHGFFQGHPERDEELLRLVGEKYSFSQIAAIMGAGSRNVCLCRFNRLRNKLGAENVPQPNANNRPPALPRSVAIKAAKQFSAPPVPKVDAKDLVPVLIDGNPITEMTVGGNMCRFPLGDLMLGNFQYCGHAKREGSSYCEPHHVLCYVKPEKRVNHLGKKRA